MHFYWKLMHVGEEKPLHIIHTLILMTHILNKMHISKPYMLLLHKYSNCYAVI